MTTDRRSPHGAIARPVWCTPHLAPLALAAAACVTACAEFRTIAPAVRDEDAIAAPELVGRWGVPDSTVIEIGRIEGAAPAYRARVESFADDTTAAARDGAAAVSTGDARRRALLSWYDVRASRLGGRLLLELRPSVDGDSGLGDVVRGYAPLLEPAYLALVAEPRAEGLRIRMLSADSVIALVRRGTCATPHVGEPEGDPRILTLTGTSAQVRAAYACLLRQPGILDEEGVTLPPLRAVGGR